MDAHKLTNFLPITFMLSIGMKLALELVFSEPVPILVKEKLVKKLSTLAAKAYLVVVSMTSLLR